MKRLFFAIIGAGVLCLPHIAAACASCYGGATSATLGPGGGGPTIDAMNTAILTMIGIIAAVLSLIVAFFFIVRRRVRILNDHSLSQTYLTEHGTLTILPKI